MDNQATIQRLDYLAFVQELTEKVKLIQNQTPNSIAEW